MSKTHPLLPRPGAVLLNPSSVASIPLNSISGRLHFHGRGGEIHAALFAVVKERGLVAGHQRVLEMPQAFGIDMAHFHVERRPVAFDLLLVGAAHLKLAGAVFHHGMVAAHEPLAEGVELVRARAVDAVPVRRSRSPWGRA